MTPTQNIMKTLEDMKKADEKTKESQEKKK